MISARAASRVGKRSDRGKMTRLAIEIEADDGLRPELLLLRDEQRRLHLIVGRIGIRPERARHALALIERHPFPHA